MRFAVCVTASGGDCFPRPFRIPHPASRIAPPASGSSHTTKVRWALTAGIPSLSAQEPSRRADTSCPPDHHVDGRRARRCRCGVALGDTPSPAQGALLERKQPASVALFDVLRRKVRAWENTYTN